MNGYVAFYKGKRTEVHANTSRYDAFYGFARVLRRLTW